MGGIAVFLVGWRPKPPPPPSFAPLSLPWPQGRWFWPEELLDRAREGRRDVDLLDQRPNRRLESPPRECLPVVPFFTFVKELAQILVYLPQQVDYEGWGDPGLKDTLMII